MRHFIFKSSRMNLRTRDTLRCTPVNSAIRRAASWAVCGGCWQKASSIVSRCGVGALGWPFQPNDRMPSSPLAT